ncbi:MAG: hypothetical protein JNL06_08995 [Alphaproteobacteria bacterium]|nr:hypothetical protein [Alphaproteobacteria bacterium]
MAPDAHHAPAGNIPPPIPEADALDDANALPVLTTIVDVGVAAVLIAPTMVGTSVVTVTIPIAIAIPDLHRPIRARSCAAIGSCGQGGGEAGA